MKLSIVFAAILLMGLAGCDQSNNEHHKYYLETCRVHAIKVVYNLQDEKVVTTKDDAQHAYESEARACMAQAEKTTEEYQTDDYGKPDFTH
jgi:uncharacterized lipoprotein YehR (DUF1307 family)